MSLCSSETAFYQIFASPVLIVVAAVFPTSSSLKNLLLGQGGGRRKTSCFPRRSAKRFCHWTPREPRHLPPLSVAHVCRPMFADSIVNPPLFKPCLVPIWLLDRQTSCPSPQTLLVADVTLSGWLLALEFAAWLRVRARMRPRNEFSLGIRTVVVAWLPSLR